MLLLHLLAGDSHNFLSVGESTSCLLSINHTIGKSDGKLLKMLNKARLVCHMTHSSSGRGETFTERK